jgi:2-polyprenyl-3-methyl-5-hydroxy-6-metoxy-1,4-benzoquinol methylase
MNAAAQACVKEAEREWFEVYYRNHARSEYPGTVAEFCERFKRGELVPFCEGGWNWWADPHSEVFESVGPVKGLRVLDYGCGSGTLGMYLSHCGASVKGFDLSREATDVANEVAARYGLSAKFHQMDAEDLAFPKNYFDLVIGFGVLHHVIKYPRANSQLLRVMKPGARAVFAETLWDNPVLNLVRRFTLAEKEAGDAHLTDHNIREFCRDFSHVQLEKRHLIYMLKRLAKLPERDLAAPLRPRSFWRFVRNVDNTLLRFRPLRWYCGEASYGCRNKVISVDAAEQCSEGV